MAQKFTVPITVKQLTSAGSDALTFYVDADTFARLKIEAGGRLTWGSGSGAGDVNLYRDGVDVLRTDDTFKTPSLFVDNIEIDPTGATTDQVLKFNGVKFVSASVAGGGASLTVSDTAPVSPSEGDLWFNSSNAKTYVYYDSTWVEVGATGGVAALDDIGDVSASAPSIGDLIQWNGSVWANVSSSAVGATNLDGLSDVIITAPEEFQGLSYNGTSWVNSHIPLASYVRNVEATTITTGTCVYLFGATGDHATVKRADNSSDTTSSKTIGVAGANITASNNGPIITRGYVDGIDLSVGYTAGDVLWLGKNGAFTTTKPSAPDHLVFIGVVVRATNNGIIYVATQNGYELNELHDVKTNGKADKDVLMWNSASALWVNDQINLGVDTVGNYMSNVVAGTGLSVVHTPGEGSSASVSLNATLDDLSNVTVPSPNLNDVLTYNGSIWTSASVAAGGANVTSSTTPPSGPSEGDLWLDSANVDLYVRYSDTWVQLTGQEPVVEDLNDLADVTVPSPNTGDVLTYDGTYWTSASVSTVITSASAPTGAGPGSIWFDSDDGKTFINYDSTWVEIGAQSTTARANVSSVPPVSPAEGDMWFDSDDARTYTYYDGAWVELGASGFTALVSDSAPSNPVAGQIWYKSDTGGTYIYYGSTWVEVGAIPALTSAQITTALGYTPQQSLGFTPASTGKAIAMAIVFGG